jgi:SP family xylose:H+ symportor-like MFS transporter
MFYSTAMFVAAGLGSLAPIMTLVVGFVNMAATLAGMPFVDKAGRRPLLIIGYIGMFISEIVVAAFAWFDLSVYVSVVFVMLFIVFFELSVGPIFWSYAADIMNDKGMSIASFINWLIVMIVTAISYYMFNDLGIAPTLFMYGVFSFLGLIFVYFFVFETKGKSKDEIREILYGQAEVSGNP